MSEQSLHKEPAMSLGHDVASIGAKVAPAATLTGWSLWGVTLQEAAALAAIIYSIVMVSFAIYDRIARARCPVCRAAQEQSHD